MSGPPRTDLRERLRGSATADAATWKELRRRENRASSFEHTAPASTPAAGRADALALRGDLQRRLLEEIGNRNLLSADEAEVYSFVREFVLRVLEEEEVPLNEGERRVLVEELAEEALGLGPLATLLADPAVTDILVNGPSQVFIEHRGRIRLTDIRFRDNEHVVSVIERIAARGRAPDRRGLSHGGSAPAGRQPRECHAAPGVARRTHALDPPLRPAAHHAPLAGRHRCDLAGDGRLPGRGDPPSLQRPDLGRDRRGQDHLAGRPGRVGAVGRAHRHHRGHPGADPRAGARGAPGDAPAQRRGPGPHHPARSRAQQPAHAPGPDHPGRGPWRRGAGHAPGHEHRARGKLVHDPRELAPATPWPAWRRWC